MIICIESSTWDYVDDFSEKFRKILTKCNDKVLCLQNEQLQEKQQQLLTAQEEMSKMQKKVNEMENLKNELKNQESRLERVEMERLELAQKLHESYEETKSITKERNALKESRESAEAERDQLKEYIRKLEAGVSDSVLHQLNVCLKAVSAGREGGVGQCSHTVSTSHLLAKRPHTEEESAMAPMQLSEHQENIAELRSRVAETEAEEVTSQEDLEESRTSAEEKVGLLFPLLSLLPGCLLRRTSVHRVVTKCVCPSTG